MQSIHPVLVSSLLACTVLLVCIIFDQYTMKWIKNGLLGVSCIYICDLFMPFMWKIGINIISILTAIFLGVPGVVVLYMIRIYKTFKF